MTIARCSLWPLLVVLTACSNGNDIAVEPVPPPAPAPEIPGPRSEQFTPLSLPAAASGDCVRDEDCVLLPLVTCCDECAPAPPFEAGPRWLLDELLLETEERCVYDPRPCRAFPRCPTIPPGCTARPICLATRCVVKADGCGMPVI